MQTLLDFLEKRRVLVGSVLSLLLLAIGGMLVWIDWHPPVTRITTTRQTISSEVASASTASAATVQSAEAANKSSTPQKSGGLVNINTASIAELDTLPGIGKTYATRIVQYRQQHGSFASTHDIVKVQGISEGIYAKIKAQVTTRGN